MTLSNCRTISICRHLQPKFRAAEVTTVCSFAVYLLEWLRSSTTWWMTIWTTKTWKEDRLMLRVWQIIPARKIGASSDSMSVSGHKERWFGIGSWGMITYKKWWSQMGFANKCIRNIFITCCLTLPLLLNRTVHPDDLTSSPTETRISKSKQIWQKSWLAEEVL